MSVTIHTVAKMANVSIGTASRALNGGTKGMRSDARERAARVRRVAAELGYEPNTMARGLVKSRTFTIGMIATELHNPVRTQFIEVLRELLNGKGYQLLVSGFNKEDHLPSIFQKMWARGVDGLLLCNVGVPGAEEDIARYLATDSEAAQKMVAFKSLPLDTDEVPLLDTVYIDYGRVVGELTRHMAAKHGRKRIVFAGYPESYNRRDSYLEAMDELGLEAEVWDSVGFTLEHGRKVVRSRFDKKLPDAIICHNDLLAVGVMAELRRCGLRVPQDIAVAGMDNIDMAEYLNPSLTSVGADPRSIAQAMLSMLLARIENHSTSSYRALELPEQIFYRESCGCGD